MNGDEIIDSAEQVIRDAHLEIMRPEAGECLQCFVARQLLEFGCNGTHRFTRQYQRAVAPRATALRKRLARMGACCCDCEIFLNAYTMRSVFLEPGFWAIDEYGVEVYREPQVPKEIPTCLRVRKGSTQPCGVWQRQH